MTTLHCTVLFQYLLNNERVEEALEMADAVAGSYNNESFEAIVNRVRCRAAFISLKKMDLRKAQEQFIRGQVDPREVISLFPRMLPSSSNFTRTVPPLHDVADINQVRRPSDKPPLSLFICSGDLELSIDILDITVTSF